LVRAHSGPQVDPLLPLRTRFGSMGDWQTVQKKSRTGFCRLSVYCARLPHQ
jgi:hypothetical protein